MPISSCGRRLTTGALVVVALSASMLPAFAADQNLIAADNGEVRCTASMRDLTRISLKDDEFASVSKVSTGIATEDFSVVNEPVRGDIYLSVPDGFSRNAVSFFGTTRKGFVYKFVCSVAGDEAVQVFIANADLENPAKAAAAIPASLSAKDGAVRLVKAMYEQSIVEGFEIRQRVLAPVNVGALRVQVIGEYRGPQLTGKTLRIENKGSKPATLTEESVSSWAIAVSIANPNLKPGEATTAYVVQATGEDQ
ncbi:conjugal transfer pilus assembly protein TraK [Novosphingobium chloroacetimidivorans]|uniref:Conjugal transfer pilus assembly protein TraK n=1 Tax=Novosphingobium chloroacetimidivorans TaxID=1428314 RepID=A0A7W7NYT7_9SPHN|nr:type-F conjugative transfer system secretin TraK [Novosphingobium chloroacetimidivorans]MBB4860527.1 conjugal transfer pilus assembly protein TraK [Novosphingobium chloroacetimidivorans]